MTTRNPHLPGSPTQHLARRSALTERDIAMLEIAATGDGEQEMAAALHLKVNYVKQLRKRLYDKLGADNMVQAVGLAVRRGIIK